MYRPLDREKREVRVIHLLNTTPTPETWAFEMRHIPLESEEWKKTTTLSYVWGQYNEEAKHVSIDGMPLRITANLHSAICSIAEHGKLHTSWWWIDAICINQEDIEERGFQVSLMRELYSRAGQTVAYLGSDIDNTSKGLKWIEKLEEVRMNRLFQQEKWIEDAANDPDMEDQWKAMDAVFLNEWWLRAWIVQESIVSPILLFLSGRSLVSEETMYGALFYMRLCQKKIYRRLASLKVTMNGWSHNFSTIYHRLQLRTIYGKSKEIPFDSLLDLRLDFYATNPRDYVYGLFALAGKENELIPKPNYAAPVWKVYADWVVTWVRHQQNLDILTIGGGPRRNVDFPSWVPDISYRSTTGSAYISSDSIWLTNLMNANYYQKQLKDAETDTSIDLPDPRTATYRASGSMKMHFDLLDGDFRAIRCLGICVDIVDGIAGTQGLGK
jgi:hypothetical protein